MSVAQQSFRSFDGVAGGRRQSETPCRLPLREAVLHLIGTALILGASGLWLVEVGTPGAEYLMLKLGLTVIGSLSGAALLSRQAPRPMPAKSRSQGPAKSVVSATGRDRPLGRVNRTPKSLLIRHAGMPRALHMQLGRGQRNRHAAWIMPVRTEEGGPFARPAHDEPQCRILPGGQL